MKFLEVDVQDLLGQLSSLADQLASLTGLDIPFVESSLDELADIVSTFQDQYVAPLDFDGDGSSAFPWGPTVPWAEHAPAESPWPVRRPRSCSERSAPNAGAQAIQATIR